MTPSKLARLAVLQNQSVHNRDEWLEFDALRRELAMAPEVADDKSTLFTDESSRPQLSGGNYNDELHRMRCDEAETVLRKFADTIGRAALKVIAERVLVG